MKFKYFFILFVLGLVSRGEAKELAHRLGVGYKDQLSTQVPCLAAQYYPNSDLGLSAALGLDTKDKQSSFGLMVRLHRVIFKEDHMNFYMGGGIGLISQTVDTLTTKTESGFELAGFSGAEFFLPNLESLGFSFEAGVSVTSLSSGVRFRTFGDSPLRAGMIFYF